MHVLKLTLYTFESAGYLDNNNSWRISFIGWDAIATSLNRCGAHYEDDSISTDNLIVYLNADHRRLLSAIIPIVSYTLVI